MQIWTLTRRHAEPRVNGHLQVLEVAKADEPEAVAVAAVLMLAASELTLFA